MNLCDDDDDFDRNNENGAMTTTIAAAAVIRAEKRTKIKSEQIKRKHRKHSSGAMI